MDLYFDFEDQKRIMALAKERERRLNVLEIVNKPDEVEQKKIEAKAKAKKARELALKALANQKAAALQDQKREVEIIKAKLEQQYQMELARLAREKEFELQEQRRQAAVAKAKLEEQHQLELKTLARQNDIKVQENSNTNSSNEPKNGNELRNTCLYIINEYDKYYNERNISTEPYYITNELTIELHRKNINVSVFFNLSEDLGCASYLPNNRSKVQVTLENSQVVTFYHSWSMDCGNFMFKGKLSKNQMLQLDQSPIKSILLKGTTGTREIINIDYKTFFIDKLRCLEFY